MRQLNCRTSQNSKYIFKRLEKKFVFWGKNLYFKPGIFRAEKHFWADTFGILIKQSDFYDKKCHKITFEIVNFQKLFQEIFFCKINFRSFSGRLQLFGKFLKSVWSALDKFQILTRI